MRKIHLCTPIFPPRHIVQTTTSNTVSVTITGDFDSPPMSFLGEGGSNLTIFNLCPRPFKDAIGWQPVCGAPRKMGSRPRRRSDGIECRRCLRTKVYKSFERRNETN